MSELTHVSNWFIQNKLTLHSGKTKYVVFRSRRKDIDTASMQLYLNNSPIEQVVSFKYLGVFFDQHLHWEEQIHSVCRKVAYGCYTLIKARECFPPSVLRTLYFSFCHSHISYCIESWGVTYTTYLEPLLRLQKRALSIIGGNHGNSYKTTFQEQQILSVWALRDYKVALFVQKIIGTSFPLSSTLFTIPSRNTRHASNGNFNLPTSYNLYGKRLLEFHGTKIWNRLPLEVKVARNFKHSVKLFCLQHQDI